LPDEPNEMTFSYFCPLSGQEDIKYTLKGSFFTPKDQGLPDNIISGDTGEDAETLSDYRPAAIYAAQF
jgi:hypothetical protein